MGFNIKGIFNLKLTDFKSYEEYIEFVEKDENSDNLNKIRVGIDPKNKFVKHEYIYKEWDEIWLLNGYLIARKAKESNNIFINPDFSRYLLEETLNYSVELNKEKLKNNLTIDYILDKISKVGFENLTEVEKDFLEKNK